jgi:putative nucleotidyltransferase with HDIG domain
LISKLTDKKDKYTKRHSLEVAAYARAAADALDLDASDVEMALLAGQIHDLGKVLTESHVLWQPYHLSKTEFAPLTKHVSDGTDILREFTENTGLLLAVLFHHWHFGGDNQEAYKDKEARIKWPYPRPTAVAEAARRRIEYLKGKDGPLEAEEVLDFQFAETVCKIRLSRQRQRTGSLRSWLSVMGLVL